MTDNPFHAPQQSFTPGKMNKPGQLPGLSYVNQINVIAILMLVQGALLMLMSAFAFFYAFGMPAIFRAIPEDERGEEFPEEVLFYFTLIGGLIGGFLLLLALMHFLAGYWGMNFKGRLFGITTLVLGLASSLTFYCAPTAIGLAVYGLIIYFNGAVQQAFEMRDKGMPKDEIVRQFY